MSQDAPERPEHADKVSNNSGEQSAEERYSGLQHSDGAEGSRSEGGTVDVTTSPSRCPPLLRKRNKTDIRILTKFPNPHLLQGENASPVSRVSVGAEPDVAFSSTVVDTRCGILWLRPAALQRFCKPRFMLGNMCAITFTHSFLTNGCINVVLPTLERRFQLRSFESAMIISAYNVANCIAIAPVAFMGTSRNKPVFIGVGVLTVGVGALLFSSVHFIAPAYEWGSELQDLCPAGELPE
ncbi:hypothetical protein MRX96_055979 [Rhipicephalus microplus]